VREASQLFLDDFLENVAVERLSANDLLQLAVFVTQRPQLTQLRKAEPRELLLPAVERLLADAAPAADRGDFLAAFDLVQGVADLFVAAALRGIVCVSLAGVASLLRKSQLLRFSPFRRTNSWGLGQLCPTWKSGHP